MSARASGALLALSLGCLGCKHLDLGASVTYADPTTGEVVETTAGDLVADQVDVAGSAIGSAAGKALGVATGNPVVGVAVSALFAALVGTGTSRLRRKKQGAEGAQDAEKPAATAEPPEGA